GRVALDLARQDDGLFERLDVAHGAEFPAQRVDERALVALAPSDVLVELEDARARGVRVRGLPQDPLRAVPVGIAARGLNEDVASAVHVAVLAQAERGEAVERIGGDAPLLLLVDDARPEDARLTGLIAEALVDAVERAEDIADARRQVLRVALGAL